MNRVILALSFPLRYYAYLTAPGSDHRAAAPLLPVALGAEPRAEWPDGPRLAA